MQEEGETGREEGSEGDGERKIVNEDEREVGRKIYRQEKERGGE